jgi:hypothetical protein
MVGSSDAITVESASSAYVENFALKVFASADDEDRRGVATRKTAKKFLAAATFFDILTVFEDRGAWEAVSSIHAPFLLLKETDHTASSSFSESVVSVFGSMWRKRVTPSGGQQRSLKPFGKAASQRPRLQVEKRPRLPLIRCLRPLSPLLG